MKGKRMSKAMFFEDAFKKVYYREVDGYILSINLPDFDSIDKQNDPIAIEMISYSGLNLLLI